MFPIIHIFCGIKLEFNNVLYFKLNLNSVIGTLIFVSCMLHFILLMVFLFTYLFQLAMLSPIVLSWSILVDEHERLNGVVDSFGLLHVEHLLRHMSNQGVKGLFQLQRRYNKNITTEEGDSLLVDLDARLQEFSVQKGISVPLVVRALRFYGILAARYYELTISKMEQ